MQVRVARRQRWSPSYSESVSVIESIKQVRNLSPTAKVSGSEGLRKITTPETLPD